MLKCAIHAFSQETTVFILAWD